MKLPCATDTATRAVNRVQLLVGASIGMERERQQNDSPADGYSGGLVFGHVADRTGRAAALRLSLLLMALPTAALAVLPTYATIGWPQPPARDFCHFCCTPLCLWQVSQ